MAEEKYYRVDRVKKPFMIDAFNIDIIRQTGNKLEMLTSKVIKPEEHGVNIIDGNVSCTNEDYKMEEVTQATAMNTLRFMDINEVLWKDYASGSENMSSSHLTGPGGENLI